MVEEGERTPVSVQPLQQRKDKSDEVEARAKADCEAKRGRERERVYWHRGEEKRTDASNHSCNFCLFKSNFDFHFRRR